jgi:hypothetical protein
MVIRGVVRDGDGEEMRRGSRRRVKHFLRDSTCPLIDTRDIIFPYYYYEALGFIYLER